ncbi:MAG: FAD-dependent oxidoreductase [Fimbriimonadaceae bacterium]|nr:FAD-dependent oxidoreductase [Fimbriimonadaceae bacterium]
MPVQYDLAVMGAGSGGIGAALSAARRGLRVVLVERAAGLGGNAVRAGVSCWEAGVGGSGLPFEIFRALRSRRDAVGIYTFGRHCGAPEPALRDYPGGEAVIDPARSYLDSCQRCGSPSGRWDYQWGRQHWHGVVFEPEQYAAVVGDLLAAAGCEVRLERRFVAVEAAGGGLQAVTLDDGRVIRAADWVDSTAEAHLAVAAGCPWTQGEEPREQYDEPSAPLTPTGRVNGLTLIYRVSPVERPKVEPCQEPADCWWAPRYPVASIVHYPCGDLNINMLPTMAGQELAGRGYAATYAECSRRVRAHWHWLQRTWPEFAGYRLSWLAPALGIREGRRILARTTLTEHDFRAGLAGQRHADVVALADHALDTHGGGGAHGEAATPYGVPFGCLVPRGTQNLLVACRGAGFSSLAASSCRLSRTMLQLGQAAGTAVALALGAGRQPSAVDVAALRQALAADGVELSWPRPPELAAKLEIGVT